MRAVKWLALATVAAPIWTMSAHAQEAEQTAEREDDIIVTGEPVEHYQATDALTGTRTSTKLRDLPLTVSVVPNELIEDRSLTFLGEALDTVPGAQRKLGYGGVQNFGAFLRGFDSSFLTLRNGVRDYGFYTLRDTANVERFEVLKGPGSVLYGAVFPGGITNTITKKPTAEPIARVEATIGSFDRYRGEIDLGGPLTDGLGYRFNGAYENADSFRDYVGNESYFLAPVLSWRIGNDTRWTVEAEHKHSDYTWDLGLPRNPISFTVPISRFLGEPDGINKVDSTYIASTFEHRFSDAWRVRQTTGYTWTDGDYKLRSGTSIAANGRTVSRAAYDNWERSQTFVVQNDLIGNFSALGTGHDLVVGFEHYRLQSSYFFLMRPLASIDIFAPVYGSPPGPGTPFFSDKNTAIAYGLYAQDMISIGDHVKLLLGGRYDWVKNRAVNLLTGTLARESKDEAFSPQAGIVFQPDDATSLYASYGESFVSITSGRTFSGAFLDPETGQQFELGIKRNWLGGRVTTALALYQITKQNVSTPDPVNVGFRVQTGEQRSRGIELEITGSPVRGWDLVFAGSYIDAEVTSDNTFRVGSLLPGAPEWSASFWNKVTIQGGPAKGLAMGFGVFYVDDRVAALPNPTWRVPGYTRFDAMLAYPVGDLKLQLNIKNISDERIYDLTSTTMLPQEPRSVTFRVVYDF